jgi:hypothetical protein
LGDFAICKYKLLCIVSQYLGAHGKPVVFIHPKEFDGMLVKRKELFGGVNHFFEI